MKDSYPISQTDLCTLWQVTPKTLHAWRTTVSPPLPISHKQGTRLFYDGVAATRWRDNYRVEQIIGTDADGSEQLDLQQERAWLARAQRSESEHRLHTKVADSLHIYYTPLLSRYSSILVAGLDALPANIKRHCPELSNFALDFVRMELSKLRNSLMAELEKDTDDTDFIEVVHAGHQQELEHAKK